MTDEPRKPTRVRYLVIVWLCAAAMIAYAQRQAIAVMVAPIQAELALDNHQMGSVQSAFFVTYALFQIPSGWLATRWGTRILLPVISLLGSAATVVMGVAGGYPGLFSARLASGTAQAGLFPGSVNSLAKWYPASERAMPNGLLGAFMSLGAIVAASLTGWLLARGLSWHGVFLILSVPGFGWALLFYLWFRDDPADHPSVNAVERAHIRGGSIAPSPPAAARRTPWGTVLFSPTLFLLYVQQFFRAGAYVFYGSWFPKFLQEARGTSIEQSGYLTSLPLLGVVLGSLVGGGVIDLVFRRTGSVRTSRQAIGVLSQLLCAASYLAAYFVPDPLLAALLLAAGAFPFGFSSCVAYVAAIDLGKAHVATVFSTMNMAGNIGAAVCPKIVPWVVEWTASWESVLLFFASVYFTAGICWLLVDPSREVFGPDD